jgi:hypothetical protein
VSLSFALLKSYIYIYRKEWLWENLRIASNIKPHFEKWWLGPKLLCLFISWTTGPNRHFAVKIQQRNEIVITDFEGGFNEQLKVSNLTIHLAMK